MWLRFGCAAVAVAWPNKHRTLGGRRNVALGQAAAACAVVHTDSGAYQRDAEHGRRACCTRSTPSCARPEAEPGVLGACQARDPAGSSIGGAIAALRIVPPSHPLQFQHEQKLPELESRLRAIESGATRPPSHTQMLVCINARMPRAAASTVRLHRPPAPATDCSAIAEPPPVRPCSQTRLQSAPPATPPPPSTSRRASGCGSTRRWCRRRCSSHSTACTSCGRGGSSA